MQEFLDRQKALADAAQAEADGLEHLSSQIDAIAQDIAEHAVRGIEEQLSNGALSQTAAQALARAAAQANPDDKVPDRILTIAVSGLLKAQVHRISGYVRERARELRDKSSKKRGEREAILRICDEIVSAGGTQ